MRNACWGLGILVGAATVMVLGPLGHNGPTKASANTVSQNGNTAGLVVAQHAGPTGNQTITLVDPETRVVAVYQVDGASGEIVLKSVRNVRWDLMMEQFNGKAPLPGEIKSLLQQP